MFGIGDLVKSIHNNDLVGVVVEVKPKIDRLLVDYSMSNWRKGHQGDGRYGNNVKCFWYESNHSIRLFKQKQDLKELLLNE